MRQNLLASLLLLTFTIGLSSCSDTVVPVATLSSSEQDLLEAINAHRSSVGRKPLTTTKTLTELAREDANRRANIKDDYLDNRSRTGFERMLTMAGKAKSGSKFGDTLLELWLAVPLQKQWLEGSYANIGVGTAREEGGREIGVLLLGGF